MSRCPTCTAELPPTSRFCLKCGAALRTSHPTEEMETLAMETEAMEAVAIEARAIAQPAASVRSVPTQLPRSGSSQIPTYRFEPGTLLASRYRIISRLGKGGMGEVFRADDIMLGQPVALKFLSESATGNLSLLTRFYDEVRIARQITHPNVCRVYDIGEVEGQPYLSMEYIDGEDLGSLLRRIGRLPADKATEFARKMCAGLAAAHKQGVLHRDLKPANIMIDGRGELHIMDFGLAAIATQLQGAEARNGTPAYMAPEQLEGREVSAQSDIYALGLVFYEMFTGKPAHQAGHCRGNPGNSARLRDRHQSFAIGDGHRSGGGARHSAMSSSRPEASSGVGSRSSRLTARWRSIGRRIGGRRDAFTGSRCRLRFHRRFIA